MKIYGCKLWWGELAWDKHFLYKPTTEDIAVELQKEVDYYINELKNTPEPDPTPLLERAIGRREEDAYATTEQIFYRMKQNALRMYLAALEEVKNGLKPHIYEVELVENRSWE